GSNIRPLSANAETDNHPWVLNDGRLVYMRWEYVDRSVFEFHGLWVMNPDGTNQMTFYGNMHPDDLFIDAKPIPGVQEVVMIRSPGHGRREHMGNLSIFDPSGGPDNREGETIIAKGNYRDPYPLSQTEFLLFMVALSLVMSFGLPLLILSLSVLLAAFVPYLFGALVLVYGLALAVFLHRMARNSASEDFPLHSKSPIRAGVQTLSATPGISWAGVRLSIGEAGGYYTIRSPTPVARIEAIEGSAQIEMKIDNLGRPAIVAATVVGGDQSEEKRKEIRLNTTTAVDQLASLVKWSLTTYVDVHGTNEFVEELIEELGVGKETS
ncbi:MAG: hypothetical protein JSW05_03840, partial [Candidatus Thorarchaeota archaeon]